MPIDTTPSTVATNALQSIPFSSLIGGPLNAAIQAQALAAKTTWEFIQNVGLTGPEDNRRATSVVFQYQKGSDMVNLVVPLLTIVPIPYIAIDTIDINFKANISAQSSSVQEDSSSTDMGGEVSGEIKFGWGPFSISTNFKANYSSKKDSKATQESKYSVEYTMDVAVHAGQDSMPAGLASVLNILRESITTGSVGGKLEASPPAGKLDPNVVPSQTQVLTITALDSKGLAIKTAPITIAVDAASGLKLTAPTSGTEAAQGSTEQNRIVTPGDNGNVVLGVVVADPSKFAQATSVNVTISAQVEGAAKQLPVAIAVSAKT